MYLLVQSESLLTFQLILKIKVIKFMFVVKFFFSQVQKVKFTGTIK